MSDQVIAAWAEPAAGPGWSNRPVWVLLRDPISGVYRVECIQPEEQRPEMHHLYDVASAAHTAMKRSAEIVLAARGKR